MLAKDLRRLLADVPDEAELNIWLSNDIPDGVITSVDAAYYDSAGQSCTASKASSVALTESVEPEEARGFPDAIRIGLPQEFIELCRDHEVDPERVLHCFIADLCDIQNTAALPRQDGLSSNGSDERLFAGQYFERCGYGLRLWS